MAIFPQNTIFQTPCSFSLQIVHSQLTARWQLACSQLVARQLLVGSYMVAFSHSEVYFLSNCQDVTSGLLQGCYCTTPCISSCSSILVAANPSLLKISLTSAMFSFPSLGLGIVFGALKYQQKCLLGILLQQLIKSYLSK